MSRRHVDVVKIKSSGFTTLQVPYGARVVGVWRSELGVPMLALEVDVPGELAQIDPEGLTVLAVRAHQPLPAGADLRPIGVLPSVGVAPAVFVYRVEEWPLHAV